MVKCLHHYNANTVYYVNNSIASDTEQNIEEKKDFVQHTAHMARQKPGTLVLTMVDLVMDTWLLSRGNPVGDPVTAHSLTTNLGAIPESLGGVM